MHSPATRERAMELVRAGLNDCEISRRTGVPRTTIRDWRKPRPPKPSRRSIPRATCPRCWRPGREMSFSTDDYAELLGLYLGDGYVVQMARTHRLRLYLDSRYSRDVNEARALLTRCFPQNPIGTAHGHGGRMTILSVYSSHLPCLFPQHGAGMKHERPIHLEPWQQRLVDTAPWRFLRGCIRSDGCNYINRTGPYEYLSYDFANHSADILDLFATTCESVGVEYRRYAKAIRIYRRASVALMKANVGLKR
jgi:hypothetical protein